MQLLLNSPSYFPFQTKTMKQISWVEELQYIYEPTPVRNLIVRMPDHVAAFFTVQAHLNITWRHQETKSEIQKPSWNFLQPRHSTFLRCEPGLCLKFCIFWDQVNVFASQLVLIGRLGDTSDAAKLCTPGCARRTQRWTSWNDTKYWTLTA